MPEALFGAAFFVGILGNLLSRHIDPTRRSVAEAIKARLVRDPSDLPPNHDIERVCRMSVRQALELMAQTMDLHVAEPKTVFEAFRNRFDAEGRWKPMIHWWHTDEKEWFMEFVDAITSEEALADFDLSWVKRASNLNFSFASEKNSDLEKRFCDSLVAWADKHVQRGKRPSFFEIWARDGWPIAQDAPTVRISFFAAWCLFLQQHFNEDDKVRAILSADWLASIDERLKTLPISGEEWSACLREPLDEQLQLLFELRDSVKNLAACHACLGERIGQLLSLNLQFRKHVGENFSMLYPILVDTNAVALETRDEVMATRAVVRVSDQKHDISLANDAQILARLDALLATTQPPTNSTPALIQSSLPRNLIAESKLLANDSAPRFDKLVGRGKEKGHANACMARRAYAYSFVRRLHAMTLQMLGGYLRSAHQGDILRRDRVDFQRVFEGQLEGHAYNVMAAYEHWFQAESDRGLRQLAILRMLGLFDRVAHADCIEALRNNGGIRAISDVVASDRLLEADWQESLHLLSDHRLITVNRSTNALETHTLLKQYFANQLSVNQPDEWREAHELLCEHLCASTPDKSQPTFEELEPLYEAVIHGCSAGNFEETYEEIFVHRIRQGPKNYSITNLGALNADLGVLACFYKEPWNLPLPCLTENTRTELVKTTAITLRRAGRLNEALVPSRIWLQQKSAFRHMKQAAICASNLSDLHLALGGIAKAQKIALDALEFADSSGDHFQRVARSANLAFIQFQAGSFSEAENNFEKLKKLQEVGDSGQKLLRGEVGFLYRTFLLSPFERAAWQRILGLESAGLDFQVLRTISNHAMQALELDGNSQGDLLSPSLNHLTLGNAALYEAIIESLPLNRAKHEINLAEDGLRQAYQPTFRSLSLLSRAVLRYSSGARTGSDSAQGDLDEALEIAERGSMKLFLSDVYLHRARLFFRENPYPWDNPQTDLRTARELIKQCGYGRREKELHDAESVIVKCS